MSYATTYVDGLISRPAPGLTSYITRRQPQQRPYSKLLQDHYRHGPRGSIIFDSGPIYTRQDLIKLKQIDDNTKIQIHNIKRIFKGGEIL